MSRGLMRRVVRLEHGLKPRRLLEAVDEAWIRNHCGDDAGWLIEHVNKCLSGEFKREGWA